MKKPAVIYARVSTQDQADSRLGIESQIQLCSSFAAREGFDVLARFVDGGVSASVPFLVRTQGGAASRFRTENTIIALCQDRFFRSVADMIVTIEVLDEREISIVTVDDGPLDLKDDDRWLASMMRAVFGELERRKTSTRTKRALSEASKREGWHHGEAPYGWDNVGDGKHSPNLGEQVIVKMILDFALCGDSNREIARKLDLAGYLTRERKKWTHTQVGRILQRNFDE